MANDTDKQTDARQQNAPADAPQIPEYRIQLLVDEGKGKGKGNGWETVRVGNDNYRYHFTGGNDGGGRIRVNNSEGEVLVKIELLQRAGDDYWIFLVDPLVDPNKQFEKPYAVDPERKTVWQFVNDNDVPQQGYYLVQVAKGPITAKPPFLIDCDPMITNEPR